MRRRSPVLYVFLFVPLAYLVALIGFPMAYTLVMSLQEVNLGNIDTMARPFVGFANFAAALEFPLARQINKGKRYADALYGELLYEVSLYANRDLTASMLCNSLTKASPGAADSGHVTVSHCIGAGIHMGFIKSYTFSQMLTLQVLWDIWAKSAHLNISFSM